MLNIRSILWIAVSSAPQAAAEKESLPEQERQLRAVAEREGWHIVDVIIVPGHSRDYYTYAEFCEGVTRKLRTDAPRRMWDHWSRKDFDVFACMDGSRFGREQSIIAEIVGRTYDAGARIYSVKDGFVERNNRRWYAMLAGMQAAGELDELKRRRHIGMNNRAARGLPTSSKVLYPYTLVRNGKEERLVVDESQRRLWDDVYDLIVNKGAALTWLEDELNARGHRTKTGTPFKPGRIKQIMTSPTFWGHSVRFYARGGTPLTSLRRWSWVYDIEASPPDGVVIHRNTHPSVYTGVQLERIIAELRRRETLYKGSSRAYRSSRYAGLFVCGECGRTMTFMKARNNRYNYYDYYRCDAWARGLDRSQMCTQRKYVPMPALDAYMRELLERIARDGLPAITPEADSVFDERQRQRVIADIESAETVLGNLIIAQARMPSATSVYYDEQISTVAGQLENLRGELRRLNDLAQSDTALRTQAVAELRQAPLEAFWHQDDTTINRLLHRIFGRNRLVVLGGEVVGVTTRTS